MLGKCIKKSGLVVLQIGVRFLLLTKVMTSMCLLVVMSDVVCIILTLDYVNTFLLILDSRVKSNETR